MRSGQPFSDCQSSRNPERTGQERFFVLKILLFGGTFDPPHNGHIALLRHTVEVICPDITLVMPAGDPPHKTAYGTPGSLRLAMCRDFLQVSPSVQLCQHELSRAGKSYTVDTLGWLRGLHPDAQLYLAMGSDMLLSFTQWKSWQEILKLATLVCQSRDERETAAMIPAMESLRAAGAKVQLVTAPVLRLCSSDLRERAPGEDISAYVPESADFIIKAYRLYQKDQTRLPGAEFCRALAKQRLSARRYTHTVNVARLARSLAAQYGADEEKAEIAGLLHDICKELPKPQMLQMLRENGIITDNADKKPSGIWHAAAALVYLKQTLGVEDEELLGAVRWHTSGHAGMTKLEKIIYMADMCSAERDYPEVEGLRRLLCEDLNKAFTQALCDSIRWLKEENREIDPDSAAALADMRKEMGI